jgi:hypothetical protein
MRSINFDKLSVTAGGTPRIRASRPMAAVTPPEALPEGSLTSIPQASDSLTAMPAASATPQPPRK